MAVVWHKYDAITVETRCSVIVLWYTKGKVLASTVSRNLIYYSDVTIIVINNFLLNNQMMGILLKVEQNQTCILGSIYNCNVLHRCY